MSWIGGEVPAGERLTARGPLLVHFFEVGELSGVRTLPFVAALDRALSGAGLNVLGVHSPRSGLARSDADLEAALRRLEVPFPVANDAEYRLWHAYGCQGWPSSFLWGRGGTLRWVRFGEGAYHETEGAVRAELRAGDEERELPGSVLDPPPEGPPPRLERPSEEVFPGGDPDRAWTPGRAGEPLEVEYAGGGAWAALSGPGGVEVRIDGELAGTVDVREPGLYELTKHDRHGAHEVSLTPGDGVRIWSLSFAPGVV